MHNKARLPLFQRLFTVLFAPKYIALIRSIKADYREKATRDYFCGIQDHATRLCEPIGVS
jgi:hypothetical protein